MVLFVPIGANSQVTIGSGSLPSEWSLLDLDASDIPRALHLPRLDITARDALMSSASSQSDQNLAIGLMIFNTETRCIEIWNSREWVSLCDGDIPDPCAGLGVMSTFFCSGSTIADLTAAARAAGGRGIIHWYAHAAGGGRLSDSHVLTGTRYYADNCADIDYRVPVSVSLVNCLPINPNNGQVAAFVNVMYDFQHQRLEAFTTSGGQPISWQWQVSTDNSTWQNIDGATSATFTIPAYFMYQTNYTGIVRGIGNNQNPNDVDFNIRELYFRCLLSNPESENVPTISLGIYFIRTNTSGFGIDANGVRYLTIPRGGTLNGGEIKLALLHLGQSGTGSWNQNGTFDDSHNLDDAGDLGDFYQWGRIPDGHQHVVWSKRTDVPPTNSQFMRNIITPFAGGPNATSAVVPRASVVQVHTPTGQIDDDSGIGYFIAIPGSNIGDWGAGNIIASQRWGNGVNSRGGSPTSLSDWSFPENAPVGSNPCPPGWRVPSRFEIWDLYRGNGTNLPPTTVINNPYTTLSANVNIWRWRDAHPDAQAVGGVMISNRNNGETVYLPAAGWRHHTNGEQGSAVVSNIGVHLWSSTGTQIQAHFLQASSSGLRIVATADQTTNVLGMSVRCVQ